MEFKPTRTRRGWRLELADNGQAPVVLEVVGVHIRDGGVRAAIIVKRGSATISSDLVTLTSGKDREHFLKLFTAKGITIPEQALVALDLVCRESLETDRGDDPRADAEADAPPADRRPLAELLDAVIALLTKYIVFRLPAQPIALALWIAHAHALAAFDVTPYLHVRSPQKRSGKTRLLELIEQLVPRPWRVVEATAATVFRKIHRDEPVILLDEVDTIFKTRSNHGDTAEALRGVLNAGYRRGACVPRCTGKNFEKLEEFEVFGAKALAGLGRLPDTTADRAVPIVLARRKKNERVARFRFRQVRSETALLQRALAVWASAAIPALRDARPALPESLDDRAAEIWEPLLATADAAGGAWPAQARKAACVLHNADREAASIGVLLLCAIKETFEQLDKEQQAPPRLGLFDGKREPKVDRIATVDLLDALVDRDTEPWGGWWGADVEGAKDKGTTPRGPAGKLAALLRPFEVQPRNIRTDGVIKGYLRADFAEAFERYVERDASGPEDAADSPSSSPPTDRGRDDATTAGTQGADESRPASGVEEDAPAKTLGREGVSRCSDSSSGRDDAGEKAGISAGTPANGGDRGDGEQITPTGRCPKCSGSDWTPPIDGGPGRCARCGPVTCLDREPGSDDGEDDVEIIE
jgi:hypothetical protein